MLAVLHNYAPQGFAEKYVQGMQEWQDEAKMATIDTWIEQNDEIANRWLWELVNKHRLTIYELLS